MKGYGRSSPSCAVMKVATRVESLWKASAIMSYISPKCCSYCLGMPVGLTKSGCEATNFSACWMRCSSSRTAVRYSSSLWRWGGGGLRFFPAAAFRLQIQRRCCFARLTPGEERRRSASVVAGAVAVRPGLVVGQAADDLEIFPERLQRLENVRQLVIGADGFGRPVFHVRAVRNIDESHSAGKRRAGFSRAGGEQFHRWQHGLEHRQGDDGFPSL